MTHANPTAPPRLEDLRVVLDQAIQAHGARRVLFAALRALFQPPPARRPPRVDERVLSNHLRRDIGLGPAPNAPDWPRHH